MIEFSDIPDSLTIANIFEFTYRYMNTRFTNSDRDILPSRLRITERRKYHRNKEGKYNTPEEMLLISSMSAPQYKPYTNEKTKGAERQLKYRHTYDVRIALQLSDDECYSYRKSKIIWRTGSYKKPKKAPQSKVKTIYRETYDRLERKYSKFTKSERNKKIRIETDRIRKNAKYLDNGDYNSREFGIMLDCYYRDYFIQHKFGCLYGNCTYTEPYYEINLPFFDKHMIAVLLLLIKKGILKITN